MTQWIFFFQIIIVYPLFVTSNDLMHEIFLLLPLNQYFAPDFSALNFLDSGTIPSYIGAQKHIVALHLTFSKASPGSDVDTHRAMSSFRCHRLLT